LSFEPNEIRLRLGRELVTVTRDGERLEVAKD
jgi:hypothetical protein